MEPRHYGLERQADVQPGPGGGLSSLHLSLQGALQARSRAGDDAQATVPGQNQPRSAKTERSTPNGDQRQSHSDRLLGFRQFSLRGLAGARGEWSLVTMA